VRKLPSGHSLADVRADDIPGGAAARNFEQMLLAAVKLEAANPSAANLPASGELIRRDVVDARQVCAASTGTGAKVSSPT
jgi:hypothetical protein